MKGIYQIKNIKNGKKYIGKSKNILDRWENHIYKLENNTHPNKKLSEDWKQYNISDFNFSIIKIVEDNSKLQEKENYYICLFNTINNGYNSIRAKSLKNKKYKMMTFQNSYKSLSINNLYSTYESIKINIKDKYFSEFPNSNYKITEKDIPFFRIYFSLLNLMPVWINKNNFKDVHIYTEIYSYTYYISYLLNDKRFTIKFLLNEILNSRYDINTAIKMKLKYAQKYVY